MFPSEEVATKRPRIAQPSQETERAFEAFWSVFPKRVAKPDARLRFERAVKRGANPESIIAGAKRYAADCTGREPKFIAHPGTWLNGERWNDEQPSNTGPAVIDELGNTVTFPPRRAAPAARSFTEIAMAMASNTTRRA